MSVIFRACFIKKDESGEKTALGKCITIEDGEFALEQLFEEAGLPFPKWSIEKEKALNSGMVIIDKEAFLGVGTNDTEIAEMDFDEFIIEKGKY